MANVIKVKQSSVPNKVPTVNQIALGELAVNTYDGKLFLKKNVAGTESIVELGAAGAGPGGGTTVYSGTAEIDFGAGKTDAKVVITGQTGILATSNLGVHIRVAATTNNTADNHWVEPLTIVAGNIVPGVGFTIYGNCHQNRAHGKYNVSWNWSN